MKKLFYKCHPESVYVFYTTDNNSVRCAVKYDIFKKDYMLSNKEFLENFANADITELEYDTMDSVFYKNFLANDINNILNGIGRDVKIIYMIDFIEIDFSKEFTNDVVNYALRSFIENHKSDIILIKLSCELFENDEARRNLERFAELYGFKDINYYEQFESSVPLIYYKNEIGRTIVDNGINKRTTSNGTIITGSLMASPTTENQTYDSCHIKDIATDLTSEFKSLVENSDIEAIIPDAIDN